MRCWNKFFIFFCVIYLSAGCTDSQKKSVSRINESQQSLGQIKVTTWNLEHFAFPIDQGCKPRAETEIKAMQQYAQNIDADIVALQEVASEQSVRLLFPAPEWQVVLSERPDSAAYKCRESGNNSTQQKIAFAVREPVKILSVEQNTEFGLNLMGLRYALEMTIDSAEGPIELLNLHLKSGCYVDDFRRKDSDACNVFSRQAQVLDQWIEQREKDNALYVLLGDFNHRISAPYNRLTQLISNNSDGSASSLQIATQQITGCHPRYPAPIDHIVIGGKRLSGTASKPAIHLYDAMDEDLMLSDHCAVSVDLFAHRNPLSSAVQWQTASKEYRLLLRALYQRAGEMLKKKVLPEEPWVVVMDLDETVLDNSAYQINLDKTGRRYSPDSWEQWVLSEQASLVPGAREFIDLILSLGGRLALVTNRSQQHEPHTWRNLVSLGLPVTDDNTCLLGRSRVDKVVSEKEEIVNDKDRRRQQIRSGFANCYAPDRRHSNWKKPHKIVFQVGDNIEDIGGVTQANANPDELLKRWADDILILPNPMYGSWQVIN